MQTGRPGRRWIKRATADVFFDDGALLLETERAKGRALVQIKKIGIIRPTVFKCRPPRGIAGLFPVLPLPHMGDLMGKQHRGNQPDTVGVIGQIVLQIPVTVKKDVVIKAHRCGFGSHNFGLDGRQNPFAASGAGARLTAKGDRAGRRAMHNPNAIDIKRVTMHHLGKGGLVLGQGPTAGRQNDKAGDHEKTHGASVPKAAPQIKTLGEIPGSIDRDHGPGSPPDVRVGHQQKEMCMKRFLTLACLALMGGSPVAAQDAANGAEIYARYCTTCHGADATGGGPMAAILVLQPPDLTALAARNDGVFPVARVVMRIDGRDPLVSHGSPMPVYGDFFVGQEFLLKSETGQPILTSPAVVDLVTYLEGLQG